MYRRRYLAIAGSVILAGCNTGGENPPTEERTPTPTPTPAETETSTPAPTETPTEEEIEVESTTPSDTDRADQLISEARNSLLSAHDAYLSQAGSGTTLLDAGPSVTGFDESSVVAECERGLSTLEEAENFASDEQSSAILHIDTSLDWMVYAASTQAVFSRIAERLDAAGEFASEVGEEGELAVELDAALAEIGDVPTGIEREQGVSAPAFRELPDVDADAILEKDDQLDAAAGAFTGRFKSSIREMESAAISLGEARESYEAGDEETASRQAREALLVAKDMRETLDDERFEGVAELLLSIADGMDENATEIRTYSSA